MKLLRVIPTMNPRWGGPPQFLRDSTPQLVKNGVDVEVVCTDAASSEWLRESFPCIGTGPGRFGYSYTKLLYRWLLSNVDRFDAVVVDTLWQWHGLATRLAVDRIARSKRNAQPPGLFVMPHGGLDPWYQRDPSRRWKSVRNVVYWWSFERGLINSADAVIYTAKDEMLGSQTTFRGYKPQKELIVNLGIPKPPQNHSNLTRKFLDEFPQIKKEGRYFLYLNRLHPKKGTDWLIQVYARVKSEMSALSELPKLVIAGPGTESSFGSDLRKIVDTLGLQQDVIFTGMLTEEHKWGAFYGCEAFVLCSHQENFGTAVVQALACDKPVLITNKVNIWREIEAGRGGLVSRQDISDFARLLKNWVVVGRNHRPLSPRVCYETHFGIEQHAEAFASAIISVLKERSESKRQ